MGLAVAQQLLEADLGDADEPLKLRLALTVRDVPLTSLLVGHDELDGHVGARWVDIFEDLHQLGGLGLVAFGAVTANDMSVIASLELAVPLLERIWLRKMLGRVAAWDHALHENERIASRVLCANAGEDL